MIPLNSKKINLLVAIACGLLVGIACISTIYIDRDKNPHLETIIYIAMIIVGYLTFQGGRILKAKYDPEGLQKEDEEEAKFKATKQVVKIRPTLGWGICEVIIVIILGISWLLAIRRNLLDDVIIYSTIFSVLYLVISYVPKTIHGTTGVKGKVKQLLIRSHLISFAAALIVLYNVVYDFSDDVDMTMVWVFMQVFLILYCWKIIIHGRKR